MKDVSMGSRTEQKIDKETLDQMILSAYSNMVLIKVPEFRAERKTEGGIILDVNPQVQYFDDDTGSHMADLERVVGVVEKVPPSLLPEGDMLAWWTEVEVMVGDTVYFDYFDSINSTSFVCGEDEYRLIPYSSCYIAIRESQIVCLNGYCLFEEVYEDDADAGEAKGPINMAMMDKEGVIGSKTDKIFSPNPKPDELKGKVHSLGSKMKYWTDHYTDDIDIEVGDTVTFRKKAARIYLERAKHFQTLDKKLFRMQRKDVIFNHKS